MNWNRIKYKGIGQTHAHTFLAYQSHSIKGYKSQNESIEEEIDEVEPKDRINKKIYGQYLATDTKVQRYDKNRKSIRDNLWQVILKMCDSNNVESYSEFFLFLVQQVRTLHDQKD